LKGNAIEALHDPTIEVCIILECLVDTLVGNKPLTPTDKYFKSLSILFFECWGIARDVPITIDNIEVHLDFYIYDILDFDLLLGYPLEKLFCFLLLKKTKNMMRGVAMVTMLDSSSTNHRGKYSQCPAF
jgi:hypothetical protein